MEHIFECRWNLRIVINCTPNMQSNPSGTALFIYDTSERSIRSILSSLVSEYIEKTAFFCHCYKKQFIDQKGFINNMYPYRTHFRLSYSPSIKALVPLNFLRIDGISFSSCADLTNIFKFFSSSSLIYISMSCKLLDHKCMWEFFHQQFFALLHNTAISGDTPSIKDCSHALLFWVSQNANHLSV